MANYKTVFLGSEKSKTTEMELQCYDSSIDEIFISVKNTSIEHDYSEQFISLDISTAIKLAKTLRTQINLIKEI